MISNGIVTRSRNASVRNYRLKSTGPSMPSSDMPLFPNCKGAQFMKKIAVIIPSYNNRLWYERNLSSVVAQDYHDFRVIYVDDCSSGRTCELVEQFIADRSSGNLIHLIRNPVRIGALQNLYNTLHMCDDHGRFIRRNEIRGHKENGPDRSMVGARDDPELAR
jgi:cellulose synthase/poly-beta-1,6-N-acetylglucosamine synthase-like glycosyltransferase